MNQLTAKIMELKAVQSLSFSDYAHISPCLVASWPSKDIVYESSGIRSVPSRAVVVGRLYHDILKSLDDLYDIGHERGVRQIRTIFAELLETYRSRYADLVSSDASAFEYWPEITAIVRSVTEIFELDLEEGIRPKREEPIRSSTLKMHGVIDELVESEDGILITEYKTTQDEARLREERHIDQVHFYSLLVSECLGKPVAARVRGLLGASVDVPIDDDRLAVISRRVKDFFRRAASVSDGDPVSDFCEVSVNTCPGCPYAFSCPAILEYSNPSIGKGLEVAVIDGVALRESDLFVSVVAGTVPSGEHRLIGAVGNVVPTETEETLVIGGLTYDEGQLRISATSRIAKLVQP